MTRRQRAEALAREVGDMSDDELSVLEAVAQAIAVGRERAGSLDLAVDRRNFRVAANLAVADGITYLAADLCRLIRDAPPAAETRPGLPGGRAKGLNGGHP